MVICHIMRRELQLQSSSSSRTVSTLSPLNRLIYQSATVKMAWERSEEKEMLQLRKSLYRARLKGGPQVA